MTDKIERPTNSAWRIIIAGIGVMAAFSVVFIIVAYLFSVFFKSAFSIIPFALLEMGIAFGIFFIGLATARVIAEKK